MINAFDEKNQEDFEKNTELLLKAIEKIEGDKRISPTIADLARLTGLHRNTITARGWPKNRLKEIKEQRLKIKQKKDVSKKNQVQTLESKLDNAQKELVYWYRLCQEKEYEIEQLKINLERMTDSSKHYESELEEERKITEQLSTQLKILK